MPTGSGVFSVTDSGIGISGEHVPRLTSVSNRVDRSALARDRRNRALDLRSVKHVLLRNQADLENRGASRQGSTFAVRCRRGACGGPLPPLENVVAPSGKAATGAEVAHGRQ